MRLEAADYYCCCVVIIIRRFFYLAIIMIMIFTVVVAIAIGRRLHYYYCWGCWDCSRLIVAATSKFAGRGFRRCFRRFPFTLTPTTGA